MLKHKTVHLLRPLKSTFESALKKNIHNLGEQGVLKQACSYALLNNGKRIRPLIVMMVAKALNKNYNVLEPSLCVEYFHTASIIADDMPCMDDDDTRRCKPSLHKKFGEATALLTSYALISAGYKKVSDSAKKFEEQNKTLGITSQKVCIFALEEISRFSGIDGAIGGQYLDLNPQKKDVHEANEIIYKKTITLFEIAFVFGWIFGGGDAKDIPCVREVAYHFGRCFQVADDLRDYKKDGDGINMAEILGQGRALDIFHEEISFFEVKIKKLGLLSPEFLQTTSFLKSYAS